MTLAVPLASDAVMLVLNDAVPAFCLRPRRYPYRLLVAFFVVTAFLLLPRLAIDRVHVGFGLPLGFGR